MNNIKMILKIIYVLNGCLLALLLCFVIALYCLRQFIKSRKAYLETRVPSVTVGIFHPYCNAGGGGERVLWCAVRSIQAKYDNVKVVIYTGDIETSPSSILDKVKDVFNINLENDSITFVYLKLRNLVEAKKYPVFTLLGQSIGSMILGLEALIKFPPDIYLDTMGYAFTLPLFRFIGCCKVGCYVHYPTISTDMLRRVQQREYSHNNHSYVIRNPFLTWLKVYYYKLFAKIYSWVGKCSETIMVNSSWTENHILDLWNVPFKTHRVYPPCEVNHIKRLQRSEAQNEINILSVGQFRPEKDHPLQLQAMYELRTLLVNNEDLWNKIKLVIAGSCRNDTDYERLKNMQDLAKHLSLENNVDFKVNVPYQELLEHYIKANIGIHTMWNEHFGIGIVECMAAGIIMVSHRSGGPLLDIIETSEGSQNGFLASDAIEYANCILTIIYNSKEDNERIRKAASLNADDFLQHFSSILANPDPMVSVQWCLPCNIDPFLDSPIEPCELLSVLKTLKDSKAPGQDGIRYEFFKHTPFAFTSKLLYVLNIIFIKETLPSSFKEAIVIPLLKKGDPNCPTNYRGLSLMDTTCKIFNSILLNRITAWTNKYSILNEYQAGFRKNYSTIDNIFNLTNIIHLNQLNGKKTYAFFVYFSSAFDLIPRNYLFYKLSSMGLSSKIIRILMKSYADTTSKILFNNTLSNAFNVNLGVKQGCILSPILFALYMNDLTDALPGGVEVVNLSVKTLMYADDIVILSDSPDGLQNMINSLQAYCNLWQLKVNMSKSKILVFRSGSRIPRNISWSYGEDRIETVNSYKYLGMNLCYNLSFRVHLENKLLTSKLAISSYWAKYINYPKISNINKLRIFRSAARSIMFYGAQIWGYKKYDVVEKLLPFFIKKMLFLPSNTPNYMLYLETGLNSLFVETLKLHFDYINKILNMPNNRLPRKLAETVIEKHTFWDEEWSNLCSTINFDPPNNSNPISKYVKLILPLVIVYENENFASAASSSQFHDLYSQLNYNLLDITDSTLTARAISLLIRARGCLLDINSRPFRSNTVGFCTVCNLDATENTLHFIGCCPIFNGYRLRFFNKCQLSLAEVLDILNGLTFSLDILANYLETCLRYRRLTINEFE